MKFAVSTYSFGSYISEDKLGIFGVIDKVKEMGFDGIEFTEGEWQGDLSFERAKEVGEYAQSKGLELVNYCICADFINGCAGDLDKEIERVKKQIDYAEALGVKKVRHDVYYGFNNGKKHSIGYDNALPIIAKGCREVTEYAKTKGIMTMSENHGFLSQDADRVEKLVNAVANDNFAILADTGNFLCADEYPPISVGKVAPYTAHVHAKDMHVKMGSNPNPGRGWITTRSGNFIKPTIIGHGDADILASLRALKRVGYDDYVSIEFEGMEDNLVGIECGFDNLKKMCNMI